MTFTPTDTPPEAAALDLERVAYRVWAEEKGGWRWECEAHDAFTEGFRASRQHAEPQPCREMTDEEFAALDAALNGHPEPQGSRAGGAPDAELRETFEAWARSSHWADQDVFGRYENGQYVSSGLALAWDAWQAVLSTASRVQDAGGKDALRTLVKHVQTLLSYARWTLGPESPGHHPTMPSAVAQLEAAVASFSHLDYRAASRPDQEAGRAGFDVEKVLAAIAGRAHYPAGAKRADLVHILQGIERQARAALSGPAR